MCHCEVVQGFEYESCVEFTEKQAETHQPWVYDADGLKGKNRGKDEESSIEILMGIIILAPAEKILVSSYYFEKID